jgi:hypothetical protein
MPGGNPLSANGCRLSAPAMTNRRRPLRERLRSERLTADDGGLVLGARLAAFKRLYRWLNLTLIHQAIWPLLLLLTAAPAGEVEQTPMPWYLARIGGPALAAVLAALYLWERPVGLQDEDQGASLRHSTRRENIAGQARFLLLGLPVMVAVVRLVDGPLEPAGKLILYGLADVAAYHVIHFGVVARSFSDEAQGVGVATLLFGLSWGIHDALLIALGPEEGSPAVALLSGFVLGLIIAFLSRAIWRWPGGKTAAAAVHFLLIYLIFAFA